MENQGYPESNQNPLEDQGALANRQAAGFEPGDRDVLGENLQTDVSDVGARGGRATIGRTDAIEHGLGIAGQEAEDTGMGARQTRSDLPPGSYEASDELEESSGEMGGYIDQGIEQVGDELDATGAQGNQPDEDLTNRFSRNEAPMGENLQTSGEDMS